MTAQTSYRLRMAVRSVDNIAEIMIPVSTLPSVEAREKKADWWNTPALFGNDRTFAAHIPDEQPKGPAFWSWDGSILILAIDVIGMDRQEEGSYAPRGYRETLDVLSSLCSEPEGTILGGWQGEHSQDWNPIVFFQGRVRLAYAPPGHLGDKKRALSLQPRLVDPARMTLKGDVVSIAAQD